jgi:phosphomannomutase
MSLPTEVQAAVTDWLAVDPDPHTRQEVEKLASSGKEQALRDILLGGRMIFGTAGLRAAMGAGYNKMNQVTIAQSAQGLACYLREQFSAEDLQRRGIVVGYDGRHNSQRFAQITASVCSAAGITVRLASSVVPTPFVAFGLRHFHAVAAVVVTASHNPKEDNGYKVYWANGAQIVPPHDAGIAASIDKCLSIDAAVAFGEGYKAPNVTCPKSEIEEHFFGTLAKVCERYRSVTSETKMHVTYTAMHGVGGQAAVRAVVDAAGLPSGQFHCVTAQFQPDPDFPTVTFPNPEEGKEALDLALSTASANGSTLIVANDPDADRLAIAEFDAATKQWRLLTGNELGALLGWWCLSCAKQDGVDLSKCIMLSSTVSSHILQRMAEKEGFRFEETLTGFKWMGTKGGVAEDEHGMRILFAFEEAIGFMVGNRIRDKDGVTAAAAAVQMAAELARQGRTLLQQLDHLYAEYSYHVSNNSYVVSKNPTKTAEMFSKIRDTSGEYPKSIGGVKVLHVRDLATGLDTREADRKARLPVSAASPMVTFYFEGGAVLTVRGSGTEPKIKWYCEAVGESQAAAKTLVDRIVNGAVAEILKPDEYSFTRRVTA